MMHDGELWQEYNAAGECLGSGYPGKDNPEPSDSVFVSTTCVWLYRNTQNGIEILFQKRSPYVSRFSNYYDRSAGGHINLGERNIDAVIREAAEEIGAKIPQEKIHYVSAHVSNYSNIIVHVYACNYTGMPEDFHFDDKEVSGVKWVLLSDFDDFIEQNAKPPLRADKEVNSLFKKWLEKRGNS